MLSDATRREVAAIRDLLLLLRQHRWLLPVVITLGLLTSALEGISLTLLIPLLNTFSTNGDAGPRGSRVAYLFHLGFSAVPERYRFAVLIGAILLAVCLKNIVSYYNFAAFTSVESRVSHDLRVRLFERILAMPLAQTENDRSGRLINILSTEAWRTSQAMSVLFGSITSACTAAIFVPLLFVLSLRLTLIALVCVAVIPLIISVISRQVATLGRRTVAANSELSNLMWSDLSGLRVIHSFGREQFELQRFEATSRSARDVSLRLALISARNGPATEILITAVIAGLALIVQAGLGDLATLAAFIVIVYRLQPRIRDVISARITLLGFQGAVEEVTQLADGEGTGASAQRGRAIPSLDRAIEFQGVTFSYPGQETPALQDISFEIRSGSTVAIVGASGAGKSTALDILLGFREPQRGRITIDGTPLDDVDLVRWRARIGVVSQDPYIFDETVRFNILYGNPEASGEQVKDSGRLAHADSFIGALPQGYETMVGDRGFRISGGQRQRLVLARALIRNPDLLILDEATNALDSVTEQAFQQALTRFARHRTIIVVAHRLATIERADDILVLDRGRLVEQGDFNSLLAKNGLFAKMYQLQRFAQASEWPDPAISVD